MTFEPFFYENQPNPLTPIRQTIHNDLSVISALSSF